MRLLDRLILREMGLPFLIGVLTFAIILLGEAARSIASSLIGTAATPGLLASFIGWRSPAAVVWAMPVGALVGAAMAIARCTRDGETTAMRAGGASFTRLCVPIGAVGMLASVGAFCLDEYIVPDTNQRSLRVLERITGMAFDVPEAYDQFFRDNTGRVFYVKHIDVVADRLEQIGIWEYDEQGRLCAIVEADAAELAGRAWRLRNGMRTELDAEGRPVGPAKAFETEELELWRAMQNYFADKRAATELSSASLQEKIEAFEVAGQSTQTLRVHLQFKYAIPCACLVLALVGAPLSHRYARSGPFAGILVSIIVVFLYNGVRSWMLSFGLAGIVSPEIAAWTQNVLFGGLGLYLIGRAN